MLQIDLSTEEGKKQAIMGGGAVLVLIIAIVLIVWSVAPSSTKLPEPPKDAAGNVKAPNRGIQQTP